MSRIEKPTQTRFGDWFSATRKPIYRFCPRVLFRAVRSDWIAGAFHIDNWMVVPIATDGNRLRSMSALRLVAFVAAVSASVAYAGAKNSKGATCAAVNTQPSQPRGAAVPASQDTLVLPQDTLQGKLQNANHAAKDTKPAFGTAGWRAQPPEKIADVSSQGVSTKMPSQSPFEGIFEGLHLTKLEKKTCHQVASHTGTVQGAPQAPTFQGTFQLDTPDKAEPPLRRLTKAGRQPAPKSSTLTPFTFVLNVKPTQEALEGRPQDLGRLQGTSQDTSHQLETAHASKRSRRTAGRRSRAQGTADPLKETLDQGTPRVPSQSTSSVVLAQPAFIYRGKPQDTSRQDTADLYTSQDTPDATKNTKLAQGTAPGSADTHQDTPVPSQATPSFIIAKPTFTYTGLPQQTRQETPREPPQASSRTELPAALPQLATSDQEKPQGVSHGVCQGTPDQPTYQRVVQDASRPSVCQGARLPASAGSLATSASSLAPSSTFASHVPSSDTEGHIVSITASPEHAGSSFEELRYMHYQASLSTVSHDQGRPQGAPQDTLPLRASTSQGTGLVLPPPISSSVLLQDAPVLALDPPHQQGPAGLGRRIIKAARRRPKAKSGAALQGTPEDPDPAPPQGTLPGALLQTTDLSPPQAPVGTVRPPQETPQGTPTDVTDPAPLQCTFQGTSASRPPPPISPSVWLQDAPVLALDPPHQQGPAWHGRRIVKAARRRPKAMSSGAALQGTPQDPDPAHPQGTLPGTHVQGTDLAPPQPTVDTGRPPQGTPQGTPADVTDPAPLPCTFQGTSASRPARRTTRGGGLESVQPWARRRTSKAMFDAIIARGDAACASLKRGLLASRMPRPAICLSPAAAGANNPRHTPRTASPQML